MCIVSPARQADNNGNWRTADRWKAHLQPVADVEVRQAWDGQPVDMLIALHARRSAPSIERFHQIMPGRPIVLVLTGTDVYRDIDADPEAQRSLVLADRIICLQPLALRRLDAPLQAKAISVVQGAEPLRNTRADGPARFVAVGHLRAEKDPLTLMRAVRRLPRGVEVLHIGAALDESFAAAAQATMRDCPDYRWTGAMDHQLVREKVASATALVHMSRLEGGANVVIEAIVSATPVLASHIDGNVGLLGEGYGGYFPVGDDEALAALMLRCVPQPDLVASLAAQCALLAPEYTAAAEGERLRALVTGCLVQT
ncbi:selenoneine biosynthesis selenosugar synthase SenB [Roseateles saccharophilus]|uniref:selenoneine biosynthesis selenosugar synthase SenB n=1 Tax=Roseateles saccharophilus TaxID=304 RepID=UPI00286A53E9|nr:selenoneine biosynthesis selenosugar synthase SenB [Roseateles saccharophilus]